jgi:hypothetical protein
LVTGSSLSPEPRHSWRGGHGIPGSWPIGVMAYRGHGIPGSWPIGGIREYRPCSTRPAYARQPRCTPHPAHASRAVRLVCLYRPGGSHFGRPPVRRRASANPISGVRLSAVAESACLPSGVRESHLSRPPIRRRASAHPVPVVRVSAVGRP